MKNVIASIACLFLFAAFVSAKMPNEKVLKSFESTFEKPQEVKWYDHPDYYEVSFLQEGTKANVKYDLEGNFLSSTRYYREHQLPTNILCKLKKKYGDKSIFGVTENTTIDEVNYYIKLEDEKNWITVKVSGNGQMELYEKYKKA